MNVFVRTDGQIRHFCATEQVAQRPSWGDRHIDLLWPPRPLGVRSSRFQGGSAIGALATTAKLA